MTKNYHDGLLKDLSFIKEDSEVRIQEKITRLFWNFYQNILLISSCYHSHNGFIMFQTSNSSGRICHEYGCITVLRLLSLR